MAPQSCHRPVALPRTPACEKGCPSDPAALSQTRGRTTYHATVATGVLAGVGGLAFVRRTREGQRKDSGISPSHVLSPASFWRTNLNQDESLAAVVSRPRRARHQIEWHGLY